jgi:hypothetical protein
MICLNLMCVFMVDTGATVCYWCGMARVITLHSLDLTHTGVTYPPSVRLTGVLWRSLSHSQAQFVREHVWRVDTNRYTGKTELSIRAADFTERDWCRILFLFPHARLGKGPSR